MRLYCSKTSPYSRKVRVAVAELGIDVQVEEVLVDPFNPGADFLTHNPLSRIPALQTDDAGTLPDSSLILDYLQSRYTGIKPLPQGQQRWQLLRLQQLAEGTIDAAVATVLEKRRPEAIIYTPFLDRQRDVILRSLAQLEAAAEELDQERFGVLEITAAVALAYLDFRLPYLSWRKEQPALADWLDVVARRPSMQHTQPPG